MNWAMMLTFIIGGAASGAIIAWSMDFRSPKEMIQGVIGGVIVGVAMMLLLPG